MTPTGGSRVSVAEGGGRGRWAASWFDGPEQRLGQREKRKKREGSWLVGFVKEIEGGELGLNKRMCGLG
jgi:hypothetical protein